MDKMKNKGGGIYRRRAQPLLDSPELLYFFQCILSSVPTFCSDLFVEVI
jgi:hypothetical protein